ncbi:MAG: UvrD-helicase domain-containing protein [Lentisphaeria bacterium]|nr:UvrD-helicase domain-containing protein [Lentisphaeria bacterium]
MNTIKMIKASAGSGKTYRLMDNLSDCIKAGTQPEGLLATTFTVKAAAELQSRIRKKLLEEDRTELASRVFDGLIGTVNGICNRLLNEYAIEAGLSPALDVLPDENADLIFSAATSEVMEQYAEELDRVAYRLSLSPIKDNAFGKTHDWKNDVRTVLDLARSNGLDKAMLEFCAQKSAEALKDVFPATVDLSLNDIRKQIEPYEHYSAQGGATKTTVENIGSFLRFPTWENAAKLAKADYAKTKDKDFPIKIFRDIERDLLCSRELYGDMCAMIHGVFACAGASLEAYDRYKKDFGLLDFVDQECNILNLLENNPHFVELMKERLSQIMVDEFQDTSPIQLALFLKLNECSAKGSIWVGDPKQAIYAFRGTDPELMKAVAAGITDQEQLPHSWRSREKLIKLSNAIFTRAFSSMDPRDVMLGVPEKRKEEAVGGTIGAWRLNGGNKGERMKSLAAGIAELIRGGVEPDKICVLFRSNDECDNLTKALAEWNIPASAPSGSLLDTVECQLVMSAFRYCIDENDTVALATLLALYGETPDWLNRLHKAKAAWLALSEKDRGADFLAEIRNIAFLKKLKQKADATPMEILEYVIAALDLDRKVSAMKSPDSRMSNMDALRKCCTDYMNQALVNRSAATPSGFVAALHDMDAQQAAGFGPKTVNVMTYHKSKGLEWPIVILGSLDAEGKSGAFDIRVNQAESFDMNCPLKDRTIHYWPWPFGNSRKLDALDRALSDNPIQRLAEQQEREEGKRLLYVGLTRARDQVIFALNSKAPTKAEIQQNPNASNTLLTAWLDSLSPVPLLKFPEEAGAELEVGTDHFELETKSFSPSERIEPLPSPPVFADKQRDISGVRAVPARLSPSTTSCEDGTATLLCRWDYRNTVQCEDEKYSLLGNAFHNFIALNPQRNRREIAERILKRWTVEKAVSPEALIECTDNLYRWIAEKYPEAKISCEVPMTYHDENGTLYQGFIDMLLELQDGYVIIDHKTHPNALDAEKYAADCAGQLRCYRKAVEAATEERVRQTIIHLPNLGMCFEVK